LLIFTFVEHLVTIPFLIGCPTQRASQKNASRIEINYIFVLIDFDVAHSAKLSYALLSQKRKMGHFLMMERDQSW